MDYQKYYIYSQITNTYFILKSDKIIFTLLIRWFLGDDKNYNFEKKSWNVNLKILSLEATSRRW